MTKEQLLIELEKLIGPLDEKAVKAVRTTVDLIQQPQSLSIDSAPEPQFQGENPPYQVDRVLGLDSDVTDQATEDVLQSRANQLLKTLPLGPDADAAYTAKIARFVREVAAYDTMWPELLKTHKDRWVAIHGEKLVDEDNDERALYGRVRARYEDDEPILITQVLETRHQIVDIPGIDLD